MGLSPIKPHPPPPPLLPKPKISGPGRNLTQTLIKITWFYPVYTRVLHELADFSYIGPLLAKPRCISKSTGGGRYLVVSNMRTTPREIIRLHLVVSYPALALTVFLTTGFLHQSSIFANILIFFLSSFHFSILYFLLSFYSFFSLCHQIIFFFYILKIKILTLVNGLKSLLRLIFVHSLNCSNRKKLPLIVVSDELFNSNCSAYTARS